MPGCSTLEAEEREAVSLRRVFSAELSIQLGAGAGGWCRSPVSILCSAVPEKKITDSGWRSVHCHSQIIKKKMLAGGVLPSPEVWAAALSPLRGSTCSQWKPGFGGIEL